ncbi:MAG: glycosyltransferase [Acidimicrobiia bacterium]|nr:glycosyltransferase [Acidimicrobiia bacterium]
MALAYLRADVLLVGRMLGPEVGAAYGLAYRIVDGLNGLQGGVSLWLFAETLRGREGGDSPGGIRGRSLRVIPRVAALVCVVLIGGAGLLGRAVPDLRGTVPALRLLLVSLPLFVVSSVELHFRSARGRYREVLVAGSAALAANVVLVLWLVDAHGLEGAAWALLVSEGIQAVLLVAMSGRAERALVGGAAWRSATWTGLLLAVAVALNAGSPGVAAVAGPVLGLVVLGGALRDRASVPRVPATTRAPEAGHGGGGAESPASRESAGTVAGGDPRVSVVILSWNDGELLERSVGSALSSRGARVEVVVVDNGSSPPVGIVAGEQVRVIRNERNRGVAAARNQGFAATSHELVCFLDSDACLVPDALSLMARALAADPTIALAAPVFRGQEPEDSAGRAPTLGRKVLRLAGARADYESAGQDGDAPSWDVDFAIGACQLVRREAFAAVGGLDESFFYGPEDVDFCLRLREAGWRVVQVRGAECDHPPRRRFRRIVSRRGLAHAWAVVRHLWRHRGFRRRMRARA